MRRKNSIALDDARENTGKKADENQPRDWKQIKY
jgi:hypothetical protein